MTNIEETWTAQFESAMPLEDSKAAARAYGLAVLEEACVYCIWCRNMAERGEDGLCPNHATIRARIGSV